VAAKTNCLLKQAFDCLGNPDLMQLAASTPATIDPAQQQQQLGGGAAADGGGSDGGSIEPPTSTLPTLPSDLGEERILEILSLGRKVFGNVFQHHVDIDAADAVAKQSLVNLRRIQTERLSDPSKAGHEA
jgi:hypothetical protein